MKNYKKKQLSLVTALFISMIGFAQSTPSYMANSFLKPAPAMGSSYNTAIGLRGGETSGLTIKHFIGGSTAIEGIIGLWHHGINITLLFEKHASAFGVDGLNWYYGGGGHIAIQTNSHYYGYGHRRHDRYEKGNIGLGIDGIVGLEFKIPAVPIALSLDIKPYIEVISNGKIWGSLDPGLGIKVAF